MAGRGTPAGFSPFFPLVDGASEAQQCLQQHLAGQEWEEGRQAGSTGFSSRQWDVCARLSVQTEAVARFVISALCLWEHKDLYYRKRAVEGVTALQN